MKISQSLFFLAVAGLIGYTIYDYKTKDDRAQKESAKYQILSHVKTGDFIRVVVRRDMGSLELVNNGSHWALRQPLSDRASLTQIENFLNSLKIFEIKEVKLSQELRAADYGFDQPDAVIDITYQVVTKKNKVESKNVQFTVGKVRTLDKGYYIQKNAEPQLFVSMSDWASLIFKEANDLRDKTIFSDKDSVSEIALIGKKNQSIWEFENKDGVWQVNGSLSSAIELEQASVDALINTFKHLEADELIDFDEKSKATVFRARGLADPAFKLQLKYDDSTESDSKNKSEYWIGSVINGMRSVYHANRPVIFVAKASHFESLEKPLIAFKNKSIPFRYSSESPHRLSLQKKDDPFEKRWVYLNQSWTSDSENPHDEVDSQKVVDFLNSLRGLKVNEYITRRIFLPKKVHRLSLINKDFKNIFEMKWWEDSSRPQDYIVQTSVSPDFFYMPKTQIDSLTQVDFKKVNNDSNTKPNEG